MEKDTKQQTKSGKKQARLRESARRLWAARRDAWNLVTQIPGAALMARFDDTIPEDKTDIYKDYRVWYQGVPIDTGLWCCVVPPGTDIKALRAVAALQDELSRWDDDDDEDGDAGRKREYLSHLLKIETSEFPVRVRVVTSISTRVFKKREDIDATLERALTTAGEWAAYAARDEKTGEVPPVAVDLDYMATTANGLSWSREGILVGWPCDWPLKEEINLLRLWHKTHRYRVSLQNADGTPVVSCAGGVVVVAPDTPIVEYTGSRDKVFGVYGKWFERPRTWRRRTPDPVWELGRFPGPWGWTEYEAWDTPEYTEEEEY